MTLTFTKRVKYWWGVRILGREVDVGPWGREPWI